ncbi:hypothetical protein ACF1B0_02045 [Streptomyces anandii]|uniref:hypothetical protein n=1 Tax=Streptomyces anandii TaxID=285454 RepID=UPI0036F6ACC3
MNTERPENDDARAEALRAQSGPAGAPDSPRSAGAAEQADAAPDAGGAAGEAGGPDEGVSAGAVHAPDEGRAAGKAGTPDDGISADAADAPDEDRSADAAHAPDKGRAAGATGAPAGDAMASASGDGGAVGEGAVPAESASADAGAGAGRRGGAWVVGAVAAAVLVVGGGGAYLATGASGGGGGSGDRTAGSETSGGHGTPPPLALDGYSSGGTNGIAPGEPDPYGASYRVGGTLPGGPGSAPVYRARGEVTRDEVARLARALGVDGAPVAGAQAWTVGTGKDGGGPMLRVNRLAPGTWTFSRYAPGTDNCKGVLCTHDPAAPVTNPVSVAAAEKAAAPVLKALGQDDAKVDASQIMGAQRVVNADPVIGGLPTYGWTTGLTVSAQGEVVGGSGQLKAPVKGDTYPVLSARRTLDLMNAAPRGDHRMGIGGCTVPKPPKDRLEAPCGTSSSGSAGTGGDAFTVDKAVFGLASHYSQGRQLLVPSWLFRVRGADGGGSGGFTVTYPALDPKYLASSITPSAQPTPAPSGSGTPVTEDVKVSGYSTSDDELTVVFEGGVCSDYKASVKEGQDRVTVTVTEKRWPDRVCIAIAKEFQQSVRLDRPLGDRKVVGSDGRAIPQVKPGARLPQPPPLAR